MESAKIPHHHHRHHHRHQQLPLQDQLLGSSTTLEHAPGYAAPGAHAWTSNTILNINGGFDPSANAAIIHSRNPRLEHDILVSSLNGSITHQDLSFNWPANSAGNNYTNIQCSRESQLSRIKRELSNSCPNLSEMISSPSSSIEDVQLEPTSYGKNDPNVKLLLSTLSSGGQSNGFQTCPDELIYCVTSSSSTALAATPKRGTFSQIYPTINVSNLSQSSFGNSSSFDMNLRALDLLNSARLGGDFRHSSLQDQLGIHKSAHSNYGYDFVSQSIQRPLEPGNTTHFSNGVEEEKTSNINSEAKAPQQSAQKRSRTDQSTRPSCQPFKVRKEKLGDRIAALQQLVAPFGKTDTASVLMEAIGYIKFLQNQVETLSVPYLKSSRNKTGRAMHGGPAEANGSEERKRDLRSRGLCLVPMSCLSYMTDTGGSVWPPPPSFGGGT